MARPDFPSLLFHGLLCTAVVGCGDDGGGGEADTDDPGTTGDPGTSGGPGSVTDTESTGGPGTSGPTSGMTTQADTGSTGGSGSETGNVDPGNEGRPDLDGDGIIDVVVGARGYDGFNGAVWIDYGADDIADGPLGFDTQLVGESNLGMATVLCDLDGDEVDELVAGSLDGIHVYRGGVQLEDDATQDVLITSADQLTVVGGLRCGDVTGDGMADIVAAGATFEGWSLTVVPGGDTLLANATLDADAAADTIHIDSVAGSLLPRIGLGDVNDDDVVDIVIGASLDGQMTPAEGAAYVFFGGGSLASGMDADADVTLSGSAPSAGFGNALAVGDFDGDGSDDIVVAERGHVLVYYGAADFSAAPLPFGRLQTPTSPKAGGMAGPDLDLELWFEEDLPGAVALVRDHVGHGTLLAVLLDPINGQEELFMLFEQVAVDELVGCTASVTEDDNSPPQVIPDGFRLLNLMPGAGEIMVPVTRHGRTDPVTFQPDGPGSLQYYLWDEEDCPPAAVQNGAVVVAEPEPTGTAQTIYEDMEAWSNLMAYLEDNPT